MGGDLHLHTTSSDGRMCGPRRVEQAASVGLRAIAVTDHNAISAIPSARLVAEHWGVEVIAGVELDCDCRGIHTHMMGLFLDIERQEFQQDMLAIQEAWRGWVREVMAEVGRPAGVTLEWDDLYYWGDVPTGGDIANALRSKGYDGPLVKYGPPGVRDVPLPLSAEHICDVIHRAGGAAVLAHPWRPFAIGSLTEPAQFRHILDMGVDGWECWRGDYEPEWIEYLLHWAQRLNLLPSGGADYHGPKPGDNLYPFGAVVVPDEAVEALRERADACR